MTWIEDMRAVTDAGMSAYGHMLEDGHGIGALPKGEREAIDQYDLLFGLESGRPVVATMLDALEAAERARNRLHYTGANRRGTYLNVAYQDLDAALERVREQWEANRDV